jgi:uncharacterized membrane protein YgaE (UPF0421/DUF939 family)
MAAQDEVYMDIPAVEGIARTFAQVSEVLKGVVTALDVLINILYSTAFVGAVGGAVLAQFMEVMKRQLDQMAEKTEEISTDVSAAVEAYQRGDEQGATKFY